MNNDGASSNEKPEKPLGVVKSANRDGTVNVQLDLDNPLSAQIVVGYLAGGSDTANAVLKQAQAVKTN